ncbi:pilus assembly protein TadE [Corynebacteriales bacterium D3-21]|uniref:Pilus assembly protein TadE n=2 Tax=Speluncibacter jeojiensis TaxID=2710754 RepID=A0A9X4RFI8_9ACTN|nr:TadE family type IV pilus minor pilin [Rhodococcus sp. D2-41]MDG3017075.1 pilus assembly protein TadE [Corynebacteriales bacterium D3-21]
MATVEAAIALVSVLLVVALCVGGLAAVTMQVRCVDAAREAARLAGRGDRTNAQSAAARLAPAGARLELHDQDDLVVATVRANSAVLPMLTISAESVAAREPEAADFDRGEAAEGGEVPGGRVGAGATPDPGWGR